MVDADKARHAKNLASLNVKMVRFLCCSMLTRRTADASLTLDSASNVGREGRSRSWILRIGFNFETRSTRIMSAEAAAT